MSILLLVMLHCNHYYMVKIHFFPLYLKSSLCEKWARDLLDISPKKINKWLMGTQKNDTST